MAKPSRRRRSAGPKRAARRPQHQSSRNPHSKHADSPTPEKTVAVLHEAAASPFAPMARLMQAFMPFAWLNPWMLLLPRADRTREPAKR